MILYNLTRDNYLYLLEDLGERWEDGDPTALIFDHDNPNAHQYQVVDLGRIYRQTNAR